MKTKKLVYTAMLMAISVVGGSLLSFNIGIAKVAPVQHFINLISAVLLGPGYAILQAFGSSILRNLLGTGTLLAFPGSMFGTGLAGYFYQRHQNLISATLGEIVGTSLLGGTTSFFLAKWLLGLNMPFGLLVLSFAASTAVGALAGFALLKMVWSRLEPFFQKIS